MTTASAPATGTSKARVGVQRFGTFLSGMIMPNIAALIAWGIITMFFIDVGLRRPNADLATIVGPFIHYLLPLHHRLHGRQHGLRHPRRRRRPRSRTMGAIAGSDLLIANTVDAWSTSRGGVATIARSASSGRHPCSSAR